MINIIIINLIIYYTFFCFSLNKPLSLNVIRCYFKCSLNRLLLICAFHCSLMPITMNLYTVYIGTLVYITIFYIPCGVFRSEIIEATYYLLGVAVPTS